MPKNRSKPKAPRKVQPNSMRITQLEQQVAQLFQAQRLDGRALSRLGHRIGAVERSQIVSYDSGPLITLGIDFAREPDETAIATVVDGKVVDLERVERADPRRGHGVLRALQALGARAHKAFKTT